MPLHLAPAADATTQSAQTQYHHQVLHELIAMGADLARLVHAQAMAADPADATAVASATIAFDRVARTIRRSVNLARRLDEPVGTGQHRASARRQIIRAVEDAIQRQAIGHEADELEAELADRLDGPDLDDDLDHRPVADIIAEISRDLGLAAPPGMNPWKRRTPDDIAALCARATEPGERTPDAGNRDPSPRPHGAALVSIRPQPA